MNSDLVQRLNNLSIRAGQVIHLGGQIACCDQRSDFCEVIHDYSERIAEQCGLDLPSEAVEDDELIEYILESKQFGFLVQMETPFPTNIKAYSYSASWGMFTSKWFYGDDLDQIYTDSIEWRNAFVDKKLKEARHD